MPADPHVVSALQDRAHDLRSAVTTYEELLERTRREPAVVTATLRLVKRGDDRPNDHRPPHVSSLCELLSADCKKRMTGRVCDRCVTFFPDLRVAGRRMNQGGGEGEAQGSAVGA